MHYRIYELGLVCFILVTSIWSWAQDTYQQQVDEFINICHERGLFNGNMLVARGDQIVYQRSLGYTSGSKSKRLAAEAVFAVGSIAKEFSAVAVLLLQQRQQLRLDDSLAKYDLDLPPWADEIKIKQLLNYTSGLPTVKWDHIKSDSDIYRDLRSLKQLEFQPGTNYLYSNNNVFLQRRLIEKVTGLSFVAFAEKNLVKPAGMNHASFDPRPGTGNVVYAFNHKFINDPVSDQPEMSGWLSLTTEDMFHWIQWLHKGGIVSQASLESLFQSHGPNTQTGLGIGRFQDGRLRLHQHHGTNYNFESLVHYNVAHDLLIVLMTNSKKRKLFDIVAAVEAIYQRQPYELPRKSIHLALRERCFENINEGLARYQHIKAKTPELYDIQNSSGLNSLGYDLLGAGKQRAAVKVFQLMVAEFPNDANAHDSLAEGYFTLNQFELSLKHYRKSLELNPGNTNATMMMEKVESARASK